MAVATQLRILDPVVVPQVMTMTPAPRLQPEGKRVRLYTDGKTNAARLKGRVEW